MRRIPILGDIVERALNSFFQRLGEFIGLHPLPFFIIPLFVSILLSTGLLQGKIEQDISVLYTPTEAPARAERQVSDDFWKSNSGVDVKGFGILLSVKNSSDDNMLTKSRIDFVLDVHNNITRKLNYTFEGREYNFGRQMCDRSKQWCKEASNKPLYVLLSILNNKNLTHNPNIHLKYPVMEVFGVKFFLMYHVLGVPLDRNESEAIQVAKLIRLQYLVDIKGINVSVAEYNAVEDAVKAYTDTIRGTHNVDLLFASSRVMEYELLRNALACLPYLGATVVALVMFTVLSTLTASKITSKPLEAALGALACVMAILSTCGLMFYCGYAFNATVSVMPFLAFAIGIDDTFMALSAWHATDASLPPHKRLSLSLRESGTAITVTSLTDVVLFGLCAISSTPAITVFSIFTAVAMAFDYIYQLTFFSAVLVYAGRREAKKMHCCVPICCIGRRPAEIVEAPQPSPETDLQLQFVQKKLHDSSSGSDLLVSRLLRTKYGPALNHPVTKICVFLFYVFYLIVSFYGVAHLKIDMSPSKAVLDDSPMREFQKLQERFLWEYVQPYIFVQNPPDFRNETEQQLWEAFVKDVESTPFSRGNYSTISWYRDFQNYIQYIDHTPDQFYQNLKEFLDVYVHSIHKASIHWKTSNGTDYKNDPNATISTFLWTSGFTVQERGWEGRLDLVRSWRNISRQYPQYNVVFFEGDSFLSDSYDTLDKETTQQVGIALLGMTLMAAFFIPDLSSIFWVGWTLLSMDFGVVGLLSLWGCDLDPHVMMNIVMSLDFAVEYAAHVCHRYYISKEPLDSHKVIDTMSAVGWPVLQGGIAALLAVIPLVFVNSYVIRAFFRTVILVVGIGLIHAMVLLPVFVSSVSRTRYLPCKSVAKVRQEIKEAKSQ